MQSPRASILAAVVSVVAPATALTQRTTEVIYDWSTGGKVMHPLYAGQHVRFRVENTNPLCYSVSIDAQAVDATVDVTGVLDVVRAAQTEPPAKKAPEPVPATSPTAPLSGAGVIDDEDVPLALDYVESQLNSARLLLQVVESTREDAVYIIEAVTEPTCEAGRGSDFSVLVGRWRALRAAESGTPLSVSFQQLRDASSALQDAARVLRAIGSPPPVAATHVASLIAQHDSLNGRAQQLDRELPAIQSAVLSAGSRLEKLNLLTGRARDDLTLGHNVDRVKVTIRSTPIRGTDAPAVEELVDEILVRRRHRAFVSTGVLVTRVRQPHYVQVHRQAYRDDGSLIPDSTFLTYANTDRGRFSTFSPAVQLNVSMFEEPVSFLFSFGATTRTVNQSLGVEPFFGISGTVLDRLVGTLGWHWGRQEQLLLGKPDEVERQPVDPDITRSEAVGTRWASGFFASFSIRP